MSNARMSKDFWKLSQRNYFVRHLKIEHFIKNCPEGILLGDIGY